MKAPLSTSTVVAIVSLLSILVLVAGVPFLPGYDPYTQDLAASLLPPGGRRGHPGPVRQGRSGTY